MNKQLIKNAFSALTIILFITSLTTTLTLILAFPETGVLTYRTFLGMPKIEWFDIHIWTYMIFAGVAIINFVLNWKLSRK